MTQGLIPSIEGIEYVELLETIKTIDVECSFSANMERLKGKWLVGQAIVQSPLYKKVQGKEGSIIQYLAKDLNLGRSDLYYCVQAYEAYPQLYNPHGELVLEALSALPEGKNVNWSLVKKMLPKAPKELQGGGPKRPPRTWIRLEKEALFQVGALTRDRIGQIWTARHQDQVEALLGLDLLDTSTSEPALEDPD